MHGLISIAAAHLRYLQPANEKKWNVLSSHHQNLSIPQFRKAMVKPTRESSPATFAMASVWSLLSLANLSYVPAEDTLDSGSMYGLVMSLFILTRGVRDFIGPSWQWLRLTPLVLITRGSAMDNYDRVSLPADCEEVLESLRSMVVALCSDKADDLEACSSAIDELAKVFKDLLFLNDQQRSETGIIIKWTTTVWDDYVDMLRDRRPAALYILAHFVVLVGVIRDKWYVASWADRAFKAVEEAIPESEEKEAMLEWPRKQLGSGVEMFQGKFPTASKIILPNDEWVGRKSHLTL
jgi:hypothetical protein